MRLKQPMAEGQGYCLASGSASDDCRQPLGSPETLGANKKMDLPPAPLPSLTSDPNSSPRRRFLRLEMANADSGEPDGQPPRSKSGSRDSS